MFLLAIALTRASKLADKEVFGENLFITGVVMIGFSWPKSPFLFTCDTGCLSFMNLGAASAALSLSSWS